MALGKKKKKRERFKALPSVYVGEGPADIGDAYNELSRSAFAVWIKLSVVSDEDLHGGRQHLSGLCGYSERRFNEVLLELERSGYITFLPNGPYQPTTISISRKPLLKQGDKFTRFRATLLSENRDKENSGRISRKICVMVAPKPYIYMYHSHTCKDRSRSCSNCSRSCTNYSRTCFK